MESSYQSVTGKTHLTGLVMTVILGFNGHGSAGMGAAMIVVVEHGAGLGLRRVRPRDRLLTRLRASSLDAELAAGASPESSVTLALRAGQLCRPSYRRLLSHGLTRVVAVAERPTRSLRKVPVNRDAVHGARAELESVAERLGAAGPVGVRGVARVSGLLTDGTGPLYQASRPGRLRDELRTALGAMDAFA